MTDRCILCITENEGNICHGCRSRFESFVVEEELLDYDCTNCDHYGFPCLNCARFNYGDRLGPGFGGSDEEDQQTQDTLEGVFGTMPPYDE